MRAGDAEQAASVCLEGLLEHPEDPNILCLAGRSLIALRRFDEAREHVQKAHQLHPSMGLVHETLGDLLMIEGRPEEAVDAYQRAIALEPGRTDVHLKASRARDLQAKLGPSASGRRKQMAFSEEITQAAKFEQDGEPAKAEKIYRDILRRDPDHVEAMRSLAAVAVTHRKYKDAEVLLSRAVERAPDYARAWLDLSQVQIEQDKHPEAIASAQRLMEITPGMAESHIALANAQAKGDQAEESIASYQAALAIMPKHPGAFSGLAQQYKTVGRQEEAIAAHRKNIATNPRYAEPYWGLANMKTFRFEDAEVAAMEKLLQDHSLDELAIVQLCNSLGLAYESRKEYDQAFAYFQRCNDQRRQSEIYDPVETEVLTDQLIEVFDPDFLQRNQGHGIEDDAPILIVGLPRSGSTLIEQILASHSQVEGTHELSELAMVVKSLPKTGSKARRFPQNLPDFKQEMWSRVGQQYLQRTRKFRTDRPRFVDKNPNNFIYAGLLHLALPNARIINARRHPVDSCFGSYKQLFASGQPFSYDLTDIGEYYLQYQRVMDHWHEVLPGKVLDVDYETVVSDLEGQVRRILDYCGLPFEEACLNFHETDRLVKTASSEQVRQPIYASSVDLWRNYESHLGELIEVLDPLLGQRAGASGGKSEPIG
jgi:tetratricopeptide (TPR) repeat protein